MSASKKLLVVFGATGNQGGSVANTVLEDPELSSKYTIRAITRKPTSPKAQALQSKGAEVVKADLDDPSTLPSALKGAHTVFLVTETIYDGRSVKEAEFRQAKGACDEAVKQGAEYIIFSSMSHPSKISGGKLTTVVHFDVKAEIEQYIRTLPVKSAFFAPASFMQNLTDYRMQPRPSPANDGTYVMANLFYPETKVPFIDISETGKWIAPVLAEPDKYNGAYFAAAEGFYTFPQIADIMSDVTGKKVVFQHVPDEVYKGFIPEGVRDMVGGMYVFIRDYGYFGEGEEKDVQWAKEQVRGKLTGVEEFLRRVEYKLE
jgi:uncharacterized protein YbjT (DUF2867 family)